MPVLNLLAFKNKKYTAFDHFHGNGLYGKIPTKKDPIRMLAGLEIISGESLDTMTGQIHFSSVTYRFWPVKFYKIKKLLKQGPMNQN